MVNTISKRLWVGVVIVLLGTGCSSVPSEQPDAKSTPAKEPQVSEKVTSAPVLKLVPADAAGFMHIRLADLWSSDAFAELRTIVAKAGPQALQLFEKKYVPAPSTIESMTLIFQTYDSVSNPIFFSLPDRVSPVLAVTTTKPYDRAQLEKAFGPDAQPGKHKDQSYYSVAANQTAFQFVDDHTFVVASEKGLRQWLSRPAGDAAKGPLQAALLEANKKHAVVVGINPSALPKDPFAPFRSSNKTFNTVSPTIGGNPIPQTPAPPPPEKTTSYLWATVAQPLLKARCFTLTIDLDSRLNGKLKVDFSSDKQAELGVKAVRAGVKAAREALGSPLADAERDLRDGPRSFAFGKQPPAKPASPKALPREFDLFGGDLFNLVQIGLCRALDEELRTLAVERQGNSVAVQASAPMNAATLMFAFAAVASLGTNSNQTFTNVGNTIEAPPPVLVTPPENPNRKFEEKK